MPEPEAPPAPTQDPPPSDLPAPAPPADPPANPALSTEETFSREYVEKLRREAAGHRTKAKEAEEAAKAQLAEIAKSLGISTDDPGASDLATKLAEKDTEIRTLKIRTAFDAAITEAAAHPKLTWAYLQAEGQIDDLDPAAPTFADTLQERIKAAIDAEPGLARSEPKPPRKSGGDLNTEADGVTQLTRDDLKTMTPEAIEEARAKGALRSLLGS